METSLQEAVECLARRAAELRSRPPTYQEKQAAGMSDFLTSLGQNQPLSHALMGGALGAGVGGLGAMFGNRDKDESERRSVLGSALTGGLAGAAAGGGLGLARQSLSDMGQKGSDAPPSGSFIDPETGKRMMISPDVLRNNPGLVDKVRQLTEPQSPVASGVQSVAGNAWNLATGFPGVKHLLNRFGLRYGDGDTFLDKYIPTTSSVLPTVGLADAALHSRMNLGERLGIGRIRPEVSRNPLNLMKGIAGDKDSDMPAGMRKELGQNVGGAAKDVARQLGGPTIWSRMWNRLRGNATPSGSGDEVIFQKDYPKMVDTSREHKTAPGVKDVFKDKIKHPIGDVEPGEYTRSLGQRHSAEGYLSRMGVKNPEEAPALMRAGPLEWKGLGRAGKYISRGLLYGGLPIAEYALRSQAEENSKAEQLRRLMQAHAKPIGE